MNARLVPFHEDERVAQRLSGLASHAGAMLDHVPEVHRRFFESLPYVLLGVLDERGWPLATMLTGAPGFIAAPDRSTLAIRGLPAPADPAARGIRAGSDVALLGIDLATRRRNRANGRIEHDDAGGFTVGIRQCFGNCPKYIQRRQIERVLREPGPVETATGLTDRARALITKSDTFFVASRSRPQIREVGRVDISHRSGPPGFAMIDTQGDLLVPDYPGNRYFNTLGNLLGDPRAALLFIDFECGDLLQLQGSVTIDWSAGTPMGREPGLGEGSRAWRFRTQQAWQRRAALDLNWHFIDFSPATSAMGAVAALE